MGFEFLGNLQNTIISKRIHHTKDKTRRAGTKTTPNVSFKWQQKRLRFFELKPFATIFQQKNTANIYANFTPLKSSFTFTHNFWSMQKMQFKTHYINYKIFTRLTQPTNYQGFQNRISQINSEYLLIKTVTECNSFTKRILLLFNFFFSLGCQKQ